MKYEVILWNYDNNNLFPNNSINIENFKQNPNTCIPLQRMFLIGGYTKDKITKKYKNVWMF